jgi:hypothetical protein
MTAFTITTATSSAGDSTQFTKTKATASSLTITNDAYLVSNLNFGADLKGVGNWTVTVDGDLYGKAGGLQILDVAGDSASKAVVTVGAGGGIGSETGPAVNIERATSLSNAGFIVSKQFAIMVSQDGASAISNSGTIAGAFDFTGYSIAIGGSNSANLNVMNTGTIYGGIINFSGTNTLTNSGKITFDAAHGSVNSVVAFSVLDDTVTNSGLINGTVLLSDGSNILNNSGRIAVTALLTANSVVGGNGADKVTNTLSGVLTGAVDAKAGANTFTNAGKVGQDVATFESYRGLGNADTVINTGILAGSVNMGAGKNILNNSGAIGGASTSYLGDIGVDIIKNGLKGTMSGIAILGDGANSVTNAGTMHRIQGGSGVDTVINSGKILGDIDLFLGNDVLTNTGVITGKIDMGIGDDTFTGGNRSETFSDSYDSDAVNLGGGNDIFLAYGGESDGLDAVNGGAGTDLYSAVRMSVGVRINLDTAAHSNSGPDIVHVATAALTTIGTDNLKTDTIQGFENAMGSAFDDVLYGNGGVNVLNGNAGNDELFGFGGNDILIGGGTTAFGGEDYLNGGGGKDKFIGTTGATDNIVLRAASDSGITDATRDVVTGYIDGEDSIRFLGALSGKFTAPLLLNSAFTGGGHELRVMTVASGYLVEGDINGDKVADLSIFVQNFTHSIIWSMSGDLLF